MSRHQDTHELRSALTEFGRPALVMIDLQQDIISEDFEPTNGTEIVRSAAYLAENVRAAGGVIVYVAHDGNRIRPRRLVTDISYAQGTGEVESPTLASELTVLRGDVMISKRQWGAFYGTDLDQQLRAREVGTVILCGVTTNFGVESTGREAFQRGYQLIFASDAMGSIDRIHHDFSTQNVLPRIGCVRTSEQIVRELSST